MVADDILMMMASNDAELLEQYIRDDSEEAFAALVQRHLDLVYSAALRQVRAPELAEEVAQSVFIDLSRNASRLKPGTVLTGWLYQVTRRTAIDVVRRESRRQSREQLAVELNVMSEHPSIWKQIEPLLDEAMETLETSERSAILLRFFENRSLREVGQILGTSEDAAQKRVSRAVERLREFLSRRGAAIGTSGLIAVLSANAVQSAPLGLSTAIATGAAALSGAALQTTTIIGTTKAIAMTTIQKILITATLTTVIGTAVYEARQSMASRQQLQAIQKQQEPLNEQVGQLEQERDEAAAQSAALRQENEQLRRATAEVPKLRGELGRLREKAQELGQLKAGLAGTTGTDNDPALESAFKTWAARASRLRQRLDQAADQRIPEIQLLTEKGWFDSVKNMKQLDTDEDFHEAFSNLRNIAKGEFGGLLQSALRAYVAANDGQLPQDLAQLKPFFQKPVDDAVLQRYKLLQTGKVSDIAKDQYLVGENAPLVDEEHDATYQFSMNGTHSHSGSPIEDAVKEAGFKYANDHNDLLPTDAAQLAPYLSQPIPPDKVQTILSKVPPGVTTLQQLKAVLH